MKKILTAAAVLAAMIVLAGCGGSKEEAGAETKPVTIGIAKFVTHPALDAIEQGIQDGLAQAGYADAVYDLQNANADGNTAASIASKFRADKVDLAVGIATPTAIALANGIKDIPVLYAAVTDPVSAGLVSSYDAGEGNVTGVSDMTPVKEQIELLASLVDLKKLGHIYSSSEANAVTLAEMARQACEELGIEFIESSVTNSAEVMQAAQALAGRVTASTSPPITPWYRPSHPWWMWPPGRGSPSCPPTLPPPKRLRCWRPGVLTTTPWAWKPARWPQKSSAVLPPNHCPPFS
jgi:putative tryptophan/tyrosine transport system substrate-binding protein